MKRTTRRQYATLMHRAHCGIDADDYQDARQSALDAMAIAKRETRRAKAVTDYAPQAEADAAKKRLIYWLNRMVAAHATYDQAQALAECAGEVA